jgi:F-type H+-transporting ATPase subunit delta
MGYEASVLAALDPDASRRVAAELTALEATVIGQPSLHAALTDTSVRPLARRAFVADLLDGKVDAATARIAAFAAFSTSAQDVPTSLGEAAARARAFAEGYASEEPALSVLASRARVGGYATALLESQNSEALEGVEHELFEWANVVQGHPALRRSLTNRDLPAAARVELVESLLGSQVSSITMALATYAVVGGRPRDLVGTLQWLVDRVAEERGWRVARVHSARGIDEATRAKLVETLRALVGRSVELEVVEQENLLGGVLVEVGDLRVDATVRGRLDALREQLTSERPDGGRAANFSTQGAT